MKDEGGIHLLGKIFYGGKSLSLLIVSVFLAVTGCTSFLNNLVKDNAGPSSPSQYFLSIEADPLELPYPAGQTEITVKVRDKEGRPVPGGLVSLHPKLPYAGWLYEETLVTDNDGKAKTILKDTHLYGGYQYVQAKLENLTAIVYILFIPDDGPGVHTD